MSKSKLELFTLLTSVRLEGKVSGVKKDRLYHINEEVHLFPGYGQGLVDNLMAVKGKVDPPEELEIVENSTVGGVPQEEHDKILKKLSEAQSELAKEKDEHTATTAKHQSAVDGEAALQEKVTSLEAEVADLKSKLAEAVKPSPATEKPATK